MTWLPLTKLFVCLNSILYTHNGDEKVCVTLAARRLQHFVFSKQLMYTTRQHHNLASRQLLVRHWNRLGSCMLKRKDADERFVVALARHRPDSFVYQKWGLRAIETDGCGAAREKTEQNECETKMSCGFGHVASCHALTRCNTDVTFRVYFVLYLSQLFHRTLKLIERTRLADS